MKNNAILKIVCFLFTAFLIIGYSFGEFDPSANEGSAQSDTQTNGTGTLMYQVAESTTRPAGAPDYSDVCLRYGWVRSSFPTVDDAKDAIAGFHATRVDWFYPGDHVADGTHVKTGAQSFINWCHSNGLKIGGAINNLTTIEDWGTGESDSWGRYEGDPFHADFIAAAIDWGTDQIDAGIDTIVCDNFFTYNSTQQAQWSSAVIQRIKNYQSGFKIAVNSGDSATLPEWIEDYAFDFRYSDSHHNITPSMWWNYSKVHRALGSYYISHPAETWDKWKYRTEMALGYASGSHVMMPWDRFMAGGAAPREYADPADYADVTAFARCLGQYGYLDGYEDAAVGGYDLNEDRYVTDPLGIASGNNQVSLFARAKPGNSTAPVIVHLVKWGGSGSTTVKLLTSYFFNGASLDVTLWTRKPYNAIAHDTAESTGDFTPLKWNRTADITVTVNGSWTEVTIPELYSWGVLIVE